MEKGYYWIKISGDWIHNGEWTPAEWDGKEWHVIGWDDSVEAKEVGPPCIKVGPFEVVEDIDAQLRNAGTVIASIPKEVVERGPLGHL